MDFSRAQEVVQWVKAFIAKAEYLSLISETQMIEGEY